MTPGVSSSTPSDNAYSAIPTVGGGAADKNMFLKLLVAQIRNQDPLNPSDPMQFVTQLAQFTQLEQTLGMSADLAAIRQDLEQLVPKTESTNGQTT